MKYVFTVQVIAAAISVPQVASIKCKSIDNSSKCEEETCFWNVKDGACKKKKCKNIDNLSKCEEETCFWNVKDDGACEKNWDYCRDKKDEIDCEENNCGWRKSKKNEGGTCGINCEILEGTKCFPRGVCKKVTDTDTECKQKKDCEKLTKKKCRAMYTCKYKNGSCKNRKTSKPTEAPTVVPSMMPTTAAPTVVPSMMPTTAAPTVVLSMMPTTPPTAVSEFYSYKVMKANTNSCVVDYQKLTSDECESYAVFGGYEWIGGEDEPIFPEGCYLWADTIYFNTNEENSAQRYSKPICKPMLMTETPTEAPSTTGAPSMVPSMTVVPSMMPTAAPTVVPSMMPTAAPTVAPSMTPTEAVSEFDSYTVMKANTSICDVGSQKVTSDEKCGLYAAFKGTSYGGVIDIPSYPKGCFLYGKSGYLDGIYFSTNEENSADPYSKPICKPMLMTETPTEAP